MAKITNSASLKGRIDIDWELGTLIVTESDKNGEYEFNLSQILDKFNGKVVSISIKEEDTISPITDFNVSSETDGTEEEEFFEED